MYLCIFVSSLEKPTSLKRPIYIFCELLEFFDTFINFLVHLPFSSFQVCSVALTMICSATAWNERMAIMCWTWAMLTESEALTGLAWRFGIKEKRLSILIPLGRYFQRRLLNGLCPARKKDTILPRFKILKAICAGFTSLHGCTPFMFLNEKPCLRRVKSSLTNLEPILMGIANYFAYCFWTTHPYRHDWRKCYWPMNAKLSWVSEK